MSTSNWSKWELSQHLAFGPQSAQMARYIERHQRESIMYNREHVQESPTDNRYRWIEHPSDGLRFVGKVHDIRGDGQGNVPYFDRALINHTGWFTDHWQEETVSGEVYQLPARDGKSLYVPAVEDKDNDGALVDFHSVTDDLKDAIRWADSMAQHYAEAEKEYRAKDAAEQRIGEIVDELKDARVHLRALVRELKQTKGVINPQGEVCKAIREHIASWRRDMRKLAAERDKLTENFWEVIPNW